MGTIFGAKLAYLNQFKPWSSLRQNDKLRLPSCSSRLAQQNSQLQKTDLRVLLKSFHDQLVHKNKRTSLFIVVYFLLSENQLPSLSRKQFIK